MESLGIIRTPKQKCGGSCWFPVKKEDNSNGWPVTSQGPSGATAKSCQTNLKRVLSKRQHTQAVGVSCLREPILGAKETHKFNRNLVGVPLRHTRLIAFSSAGARQLQLLAPVRQLRRPPRIDRLRGLDFSHPLPDLSGQNRCQKRREEYKGARILIGSVFSSEVKQTRKTGWSPPDKVVCYSLNHCLAGICL